MKKNKEKPDLDTLIRIALGKPPPDKPEPKDAERTIREQYEQKAKRLGT